MKQKLTIDMLLPLCRMDDIYDNNIVLYRKYTRAKDKLCPYRIFDINTAMPYCKWVIEKQHYDIKKIGKWG